MEHRSISIADQIFDQLERDILAGKYARGEVISELGLSKQLGVSRTPIREAIRRLEQEDFLEESGRGAVVVGISREDMEDMYEIRAQIEGLAARRAALNVSDEELRAMRDVLDLQRFYVEKNGENRPQLGEQVLLQYPLFASQADDQIPQGLRLQTEPRHAVTPGTRGDLRGPRSPRPGRGGEGGACACTERKSADAEHDGGLRNGERDQRSDREV